MIWLLSYIVGAAATVDHVGCGGHFRLAWEPPAIGFRCSRCNFFWDGRQKGVAEWCRCSQGDAERAREIAP